ncbi:MAG: hypothetical protein Q8916_06945 [Bacteroidota bacterium]|nr:hypothetical protein [Bacteroidota bacterium]MDP4230127.1 hypothetical protein [Bacteroidota bacterium]MDP4236609.1 hypothetical protein [Bacteroidota bacterium]
MLRRYFHTLTAVLLVGMLLSACKTSTTEPGNQNTNTNIGDSIPRLNSAYSYLISQLDQSGNLDPISTIQGNAFVDTGKLSIFSKSSSYSIIDQSNTAHDTAFFLYESNSDVSMYLKDPGFLNNYRNGQRVDETLEAVANAIFHQWITLPIASKGTVSLPDLNTSFSISGGQVPANIHTTVDFVGDSNIVATNGNTLMPDTLASKHCILLITAKLSFGNEQVTLTHQRDIWFVPRIGYIGKEMTRTNMPAVPVYVIPLDTTATIKTLTSYMLR